jgi:hypothetical protein
MYTHVDQAAFNSCRQTWSLYSVTTHRTFHHVPPIQAQELGHPTDKLVPSYIAKMNDGPYSQTNISSWMWCM